MDEKGNLFIYFRITITLSLFSESLQGAYQCCVVNPFGMANWALSWAQTNCFKLMFNLLCALNVL